MLIEIKVKVARIIDSKTRKRIETFLIDKEVFAEAEYAVTTSLVQEQELGTIEDFEIQSLKISSIKEICEETMPGSAFTFIATLKDIFHDDEGNEKVLKYKVLLWANDLTQANQRTHQLAREGYDMQIEGIKQVEYEYLTEHNNEQAPETNE